MTKNHLAEPASSSLLRRIVYGILCQTDADL